MTDAKNQSKTRGYSLAENTKEKGKRKGGIEQGLDKDNELCSVVAGFPRKRPDNRVSSPRHIFISLPWEWKGNCKSEWPFTGIMFSECPGTRSTMCNFSL
jgi:hypothetical protein